jgi:hypothetical protein
MPRPMPTDYASFYANYVGLVAADDVLSALKNDFEKQQDFFKNIPIEKHEYQYAADKWTMKEMLQHIIDTERIFAYRALAFARHDQTALPGFDENLYAANSNANARNWSSLCEELILVRKSSIHLFETFAPSTLQQVGNASNKNITVNAIGFIIVGHLLHHKSVAIERYL